MTIFEMTRSTKGVKACLATLNNKKNKLTAKNGAI